MSGTSSSSGKRPPGRRGRPPKSGWADDGVPKSSYYFSIKQATSGELPIDKDSLIETPYFQDFENCLCQSRDELIHVFKSIAAKKGFKAIIPFTDRNNKV